MKYDKKNWYFTYERKMSYQRIKLFNYGYCRQLSNFFNVKINSEIYRIKDENVSVYYDLDEHTKAFDSIRSIFSSKNSLKIIKKIKNIIKSYYKEFIEDIENRPIDYSNSSNQDIISAIESFSRQNEKISLPTWLLYLYVEDILTAEIRKHLQLSIKDKIELENILTFIAKPTKILPLDVYQKDLYKIVLLSGSKQKKALEKFSKKYISWGVYDVNYDVIDASIYEQKIKEIDKATARKKIQEIDEKYKTQIKNINDIKKYWINDKNLNALIDLYFLYANFKDWKNYYREQSSYKMKILFNEIAKRLLLTAKEVSFLTEEETTSSLEGKIKINSGEIEKRIKDSALVFLDNEMLIVTDGLILKEIDNLIETKNVSYVTGHIAYKGVIKGKVKLVSSVKDFNEINDGDIIVSSTTRPDYLPFMKKSGGFITNEGGMLSHAAIMARELKKPCIIGTKIATKIFKDGDLIEVDAERGVVRILKKNNE